jgi:phage FluMu protein Com
MKDADEGGTVVCVSCGKLMHYSEAHAGHFISRRHMSVRWDEQNVHVQCPRCNTFLDGALDEYSRFILDKYGRETLDALLASKHETKKWLRDELQTLIAFYESAAREYEARLSGYVGSNP